MWIDITGPVTDMFVDKDTCIINGIEYVESPNMSEFIYPASEYVESEVTEEEEYIISVVLNRVYYRYMRITPFVDGLAYVNDVNPDINPPREMVDEISRGAEWVLSLIRS